MAERDTLYAVLDRWHTLQDSWNDRCFTRIQSDYLKPLEQQSTLLLEQEAEIFRFVSLIEEELEELRPGFR